MSNISYLVILLTAFHIKFLLLLAVNKTVNVTKFKNRKCVKVIYKI